MEPAGLGGSQPASQVSGTEISNPCCVLGVLRSRNGLLPPDVTPRFLSLILPFTSTEDIRQAGLGAMYVVEVITVCGITRDHYRDAGVAQRGAVA